MSSEHYYRKKAVVIEAFQPKAFSTDGTLGVYAWELWPLWAREAFKKPPGEGIWWDEQGQCLVIATLEGVMKCGEKDWIIRGVKGEIYACKPDIFEATYDKVTNAD